MRQAGRYLPEYRALRERHSMGELLAQPELAVEATLQPLKRFPLDAAIIFMDILPPLAGMGLEISFGDAGRRGSARGQPHLPHPRHRHAGRAARSRVAGGAPEADRPCARRACSSATPLIGFSGAPFTLASYAIEGSGQQELREDQGAHVRRARRVAAAHVEARHGARRFSPCAGAGRAPSALQVFDSWAGIALGRDDYVRYVQPYNRQLFAAVRPAGVPVINFSTGTAAYIEEVAACGGDVVGVDWRMPIGSYREQDRRRTRPSRATSIPVALLAPWRELRPRIDEILARPAETATFSISATASFPRRRWMPWRASWITCTRGTGRAAMSAPIGVLLMAYGGPDSLEEVPGYLADIRTGRPTPRAVVRGNHRALPADRRHLAAARAQLAPASRPSRRGWTPRSTAATSACVTGRRGSRRWSAPWRRRASRGPSASSLPLITAP